MKVLMIGWDKTPLLDREHTYGDLQDRLLGYSKRLSEIHLIVFSRKHEGLKPRKIGENVFVYPTSSLSPVTYVPDGFMLASGIIKKYGVDIVSAQDALLTGLLGYFLKVRYRIPLNIQVHGDYIDNIFWLRESKLNYLFNTLGRYIIKNADSVRVVGARIKRHIEKHLKIKSKRIFVLPVHTNINKFLYAPSRSIIRKKYSKYDHIVLYVGRLSREKNIPNLLRSIPDVVDNFPGTLFLIVGSGDARAELEKLVQQLSINRNVVLEGAVSHDILADYYYSSDITVIPSNYEGYGLVAVESLACGRPVIMTDTGCAGDMVIDGLTGYVVPVNRPKILSKKIIQLLQDTDLRMKMGENGRNLVIKTQLEKDDLNRMIEMYETTIKFTRQAFI